MGAELLTNCTFDSNTNGWIVPAVLDGNNMGRVSSGGLNNSGCIRADITRTSNPGMCTIRQTISTAIQTGKQYILSFYARRSGTIDVWAAIEIDGVFTHLASAISQLSTDPNQYRQVRYIYNVPSQSNTHVTARITLIAGSATGSAWFDNVSFTMAGGEENPATVTYQNCNVEQTTYLFESPSLDSVHVISVGRSTRLNLYECDNNSFIRCKYNNKYYYIKRAHVNTADSDATSTRNAANMFGSTLLQYAYPAPELAQVYNLQWTLTLLGYNCGTVDGKFGQGTDSAVRNFQRDKGIGVDGKVGTTTKEYLIEALNALTD